jgi:hypothetical protein
MNKIMRVTLVCWIDEVCTEMHFQRSTFHMSLVYLDKFIEQTPMQYGPEEL